MCAPRVAQRTMVKLVAIAVVGRVCCGLPSNVAMEPKGRTYRELPSTHQATRVDARVVSTTAGECVGHRVEATGIVFNSKIETKQLVDLVLLRNGRQSLVKDELQALVVRADEGSGNHIDTVVGTTPSPPSRLATARRSLASNGTSQRGMKKAKGPMPR